MKRREFLQLSGFSSVAALLARFGWPVHGTATEEATANNSNQPLITIPFPIAARGEVAPPVEHRIYIPLVGKGD